MVPCASDASWSNRPSVWRGTRDQWAVLVFIYGEAGARQAAEMQAIVQQKNLTRSENVGVRP